MLSTVAPPGAASRDRPPSRRAFPVRAIVGVAIGIAILAAVAAVLLPVARTERRPSPIRIAPTVTTASAPPIVEVQRLVPLSPEAARIANADRPIEAGPLVAALPFRTGETGASRERAVDCLAAAGWYEAGDDARGQRGVMQVVLNRARLPVFPATVCGVVFQGAERQTGCQFTFTCDGSILRRHPSAAALSRARERATAALAGAVDRDVGLSTHYHADYVVPYWAASLEKSARVEAHLFYRWKGFWGTRAAFVRAASDDEPVIAALAAISPAHHGLPTLSPVPLPVSTEVTVAAAALPPPIAVAGVREKSLRGAVVRAAGGQTDHFFLQLDPATYPGNYATAAVALCKDKPSCVVLGWRDPTSMGEALPLAPAQREALSFYYVQGADGAGRALWNCQQLPRSNKTQCLSAADLG